MRSFCGWPIERKRTFYGTNLPRQYTVLSVQRILCLTPLPATLLDRKVGPGSAQRKGNADHPDQNKHIHQPILMDLADRRTSLVQYVAAPQTCFGVKIGCYVIYLHDKQILLNPKPDGEHLRPPSNNSSACRDSPSHGTIHSGFLSKRKAARQ